MSRTRLGALRADFAGLCRREERREERRRREVRRLSSASGHGTRPIQFNTTTETPSK